MPIRPSLVRHAAPMFVLCAAVAPVLGAQLPVRTPFTAADALDITTSQIADLSPDGRWLLVTSASRRDGLGVEYRRDTDPTYIRVSPSRLQVIDTGPGIPEKLMPKIFQPFFTTKGTAKRGEAKGTGLGLSICKEIVEHHKGRIEVESIVGKGTTFTIYLPHVL